MGLVALMFAAALEQAAAASQSAPPPQAMRHVVPARYYPKLARAQGVEGEATVECRVTLEGKLADCVVLGETPTGYGFGQAVVNWAQTDARIKVKPDATGNERVSFPMRFALGLR